MSLRNYSQPVKILSIFAILFVYLGLMPSAAQQLPQQQMQPAEYTDDELVVFITVAQKVMPLQQESQEEMIEKIEDEDLTVEKFNNILEAHSTGQEADATADEIQSFNTAMEAIQEIQFEYEHLIVETITDEGMAPAKYEEILANYQQDPELQMRVAVLMEEIQDE